MDGLGILIFVFFAMLVLIYVAKSIEWKHKADLYDKKEFDPAYVPNYQELIEIIKKENRNEFMHALTSLITLITSKIKVERWIPVPTKTAEA